MVPLQGFDLLGFKDGTPLKVQVYIIYIIYIYV